MGHVLGVIDAWVGVLAAGGLAAGGEQGWRVGGRLGSRHEAGVILYRLGSVRWIERDM